MSTHTPTLVSLDHCARAVRPARPFNITTYSSAQTLRCVHSLLVRHEKHINGTQVLSHKGYTEAPQPIGQSPDFFISPHAERRKVYVVIYIGPVDFTLNLANYDLDIILASPRPAFLGGTSPGVSKPGGYVKLAAVYQSDPFEVLESGRGRMVDSKWRFWAEEEQEGYASKGTRREVVEGLAEAVATSRDMLTAWRDRQRRRQNLAAIEVSN